MSDKLELTGVPGSPGMPGSPGSPGGPTVPYCYTMGKETCQHS